MILGITGGISTGKSTAAHVVARAGGRIIDCDEISHYLSNYDPDVLSAIRSHFGEDVFREHGALDRVALAKRVFADAAERDSLEQILHPPIKAVVHANIRAARAQDSPLVVVAPLLIEAGMAGDVDWLWVVSCTPEHQLQRLRERTRVDAAEAQSWIDAQMPLEVKEKQANVVLRNDGTIEEFETAVAREWGAFLALER